MKLILLRHGESIRNAMLDEILPGEENNLTIKGVHQAVEAANSLKERKIDMVYCSPAKRCEQTMDEILRVREDQFQISFSSLIGPRMKNEDLSKVRSRVALFLDDLKNDFNDNQTVLVVSHLAVIRMIIYQLTRNPEGSIANGKIIELDLNSE